MMKSFYTKPNGEDGYFVEKQGDFCDPNKLEWCKFCAHCGHWVTQPVCVSESAFNILLNGVKIVEPNGHCNKFKLPSNFEQYSRLKSMILKKYCIEMTQDKE